MTSRNQSAAYGMTGDQFMDMFGEALKSDGDAASMMAAVSLAAKGLLAMCRDSSAGDAGEHWRVALLVRLLSAHREMSSLLAEFQTDAHKAQVKLSLAFLREDDVETDKRASMVHELRAFSSRATVTFGMLTVLMDIIDNAAQLVARHEVGETRPGDETLQSACDMLMSKLDAKVSRVNAAHYVRKAA